MKYKDMFILSPKNQKQLNNKIIKKKHEAGKKKENYGNSKIMRSGSTSAMFQNSITEHTTKKKLNRQKN